MTLRAATPLPALVLAAVLAAAGALAAADSAPGPRERAELLYDEGRYLEALPLLESLAAEEDPDGTLLYRLYYCQRNAAHPSAGATLERARRKLEQEIAQRPDDLERAFYLANAYEALGRGDDARRVAREATARIEERPPEAPVELFRAGRLFAAQGLDEQAAAWYRRSVDAFMAEHPEASSPYIDWAARFLAERAFRERRWEDADRFYSIVLEGGLGTPADFDRLGTARARSGRFLEASRAWRTAERLDPARADRPRYCSRLAERAHEVQPLPTTAPDGRPWGQLTQPELEELLKARAATVRETIAAFQENSPVSNEERRAMQARIDEAKPVFVAAGLEYVLRGHSIREAAFFSGYAPLIFHARSWYLPSRRFRADPQDRRPRAP